MMMRAVVALLPAVLVSMAAYAQEIPPAPESLASTPTQPLDGQSTLARPTIIVGSPNIPDYPTAFEAIDFNSPNSPLAGVVSIYSAFSASNGTRGSGVVLDATHILTAAHVVDFLGGVDAIDQVTGDGLVDAMLPYSRVYLNNIAAPEPFLIESIHIHSDWHGFGNVSAPDGGAIHDDLAIITLKTPLPASIPAYPLYQTSFHQDFGKIILLTGYGGGGDAVNGITQPATVEIKRYGWNLTVTYETDDEPSPGTRSEVFLADFDAPDPLGDPSLSHTGFDGYTSLGNNYEAIISPGDSGGPVFLVEDRNGNGFVEADEMIIFGLATFTFDTPDGAWPHFGAGFGGPIVSAYLDFIGGFVAIPEPASLALLAGALPLVMRRRARTRP